MADFDDEIILSGKSYGPVGCSSFASLGMAVNARTYLYVPNRQIRQDMFRDDSNGSFANEFRRSDRNTRSLTWLLSVGASYWVSEQAIKADGAQLELSRSGLHTPRSLFDIKFVHKLQNVHTTKVIIRGLLDGTFALNPASSKPEVSPPLQQEHER